MSRRRDGSKKAAPTTVRFSQDTLEFLRAAAQHHEAGIAGVVNDAVRLYREKLEAKSERILDGISSNPG